MSVLLCKVCIGHYRCCRSSGFLRLSAVWSSPLLREFPKETLRGTTINWTQKIQSRFGSTWLRHQYINSLQVLQLRFISKFGFGPNDDYVKVSLYTPWLRRRSGGITPHILILCTRYLLIKLRVAVCVSWIKVSNCVLKSNFRSVWCLN
jgi:hypothetical protein